VISRLPFGKKLTDKQKRIRALRKVTNNINDIEDEYAKACYYIQKILHVRLTPDYPFSTFIEHLYQINKDPNPFNLSFLNKKGKIDRTLGG
jgi:hypothetical protein